ncbi:hypothetical protein [Hydrogenimonas sp.]
MGISKTLSSLLLGATLTVSSLQSNVATYKKHEETVLSEINRYQDDERFILMALDNLYDSGMKFNDNVTKHIKSHIDEWLKEDSTIVSSALALTAKHVETKLSFLKQLRKHTRNKKIKEKIDLLVDQSKKMKRTIQGFIDYAYLYIDAKMTYELLKRISSIQIDDFWFVDSDDKEKTLFIISKEAATKPIEEIYEEEDRLNGMLPELSKERARMSEALNLPKIADYSFDGIGRHHFSNVSFI